MDNSALEHVVTEEASQEHYFGLPAAWFERADDEIDDVFYEHPRMVARVDEATLSSLTDFYRNFIPAHADVLDLMSLDFPPAARAGSVSRGRIRYERAGVDCEYPAHRVVCKI